MDLLWREPTEVQVNLPAEHPSFVKHMLQLHVIQDFLLVTLLIRFFLGLKLNNLVTNNMWTRIENGSENLLMEHSGHLFSFYGSDKVVWQMFSVKVKTT